MANLNVFLKLLYMLHFSVYRVSVPILCFAMLKPVFKTTQTLDSVKVEIMQSIRTIGWILHGYIFFKEHYIIKKFNIIIYIDYYLIYLSTSIKALIDRTLTLALCFTLSNQHLL